MARGKRGVPIAIYKTLRINIKNCGAIDEQIILLDMMEKYREKIVIIGAYAPIDDAKVKVKF